MKYTFVREISPKSSGRFWVLLESRHEWVPCSLFYYLSEIGIECVLDRNVKFCNFVNPSIPHMYLAVHLLKSCGYNSMTINGLTFLSKIM